MTSIWDCPPLRVLPEVVMQLSWMRPPELPIADGLQRLTSGSAAEGPGSAAQLARALRQLADDVMGPWRSSYEPALWPQPALRSRPGLYSMAEDDLIWLGIVRFHNAVSPLISTMALVSQELLPSRSPESLQQRYKNLIKRRDPLARLIIDHACIGAERPAAWAEQGDTAAAAAAAVSGPGSGAGAGAGQGGGSGGGGEQGRARRGPMWAAAELGAALTAAFAAAEVPGRPSAAAAAAAGVLLHQDGSSAGAAADTAAGAAAAPPAVNAGIQLLCSVVSEVAAHLPMPLPAPLDVPSASSMRRMCRFSHLGGTAAANAGQQLLWSLAARQLLQPKPRQADAAVEIEEEEDSDNDQDGQQQQHRQQQDGSGDGHQQQQQQQQHGALLLADAGAGSFTELLQSPVAASEPGQQQPAEDDRQQQQQQQQQQDDRQQQGRVAEPAGQDGQQPPSLQQQQQPQQQQGVDAGPDPGRRVGSSTTRAAVRQIAGRAPSLLALGEHERGTAAGLAQQQRQQQQQQSSARRRQRPQQQILSRDQIAQQLELLQQAQQQPDQQPDQQQQQQPMQSMVPGLTASSGFVPGQAAAAGSKHLRRSLFSKHHGAAISPAVAPAAAEPAAPRALPAAAAAVGLHAQSWYQPAAPSSGGSAAAAAAAAAGRPQVAAVAGRSPIKSPSRPAAASAVGGVGAAGHGRGHSSPGARGKRLGLHEQLLLWQQIQQQQRGLPVQQPRQPAALASPQQQQQSQQQAHVVSQALALLQQQAAGAVAPTASSGAVPLPGAAGPLAAAGSAGGAVSGEFVQQLQQLLHQQKQQQQQQQQQPEAPQQQQGWHNGQQQQPAGALGGATGPAAGTFPLGFSALEALAEAAAAALNRNWQQQQ